MNISVNMANITTFNSYRNFHPWWLFPYFTFYKHWIRSTTTLQNDNYLLGQTLPSFFKQIHLSPVMAQCYHIYSHKQHHETCNTYMDRICQIVPFTGYTLMEMGTHWWECGLKFQPLRKWPDSWVCGFVCLFLNRI